MSLVKIQYLECICSSYRIQFATVQMLSFYLHVLVYLSRALLVYEIKIVKVFKGCAFTHGIPVGLTGG